jgi:hypothetical protein
MPGFSEARNSDQVIDQEELIFKQWTWLVVVTLPNSNVRKYYSRFPQDLSSSTSMPNVYFCQPHAKNQGMLRAVLSVNECEAVVRQHPATYVGEDFPRLSNDPKAVNDFAVIRFHPEETTAVWRSGYYRVDSDLNKLNESLLALSR